MAIRIAGVTIPQHKQLEVALTSIYGIGRSTSRKILTELGLSFSMKSQDLSEDQANKLRTHIEHGAQKIEGDLRREIVANIRRLKDIGSYRGSRHAKKLPARGQRTKTNSRSVRGNVRRTMGSGRKPPAQKT